MPTRRSLLLVAALAVTGALAAPALAEPIERAPAARVCMMNNTLFPQDQIPVAVAGKTYYGCCEGCKKRLAEEAQFRQATDPVSGKTVDKASAVIGVRPDGKVLYFESEKTFAAYAKRKAS
jgi:YHS domain-containing protein